MTDHTAPERLYTRAEVDALVAAALENVAKRCDVPDSEKDYSMYMRGVSDAFQAAAKHARALTPSDARAALRAHTEAAVRRALEGAAAVCRRQAEEFKSDEYATGQPLSSFKERFACAQCDNAIRALDPAKFIGGKNEP